MKDYGYGHAVADDPDAGHVPGAGVCVQAAGDLGGARDARADRAVLGRLRGGNPAVHPPAGRTAGAESGDVSLALDREVGRLRVGLAAAGAAILGALPHVLHHVGPLAGAAIFAGAGGSLLFGVIGLIAAVPFLLKVRRRSGGWRLPAILLMAFAGLFALSTFVVAPAIQGGDEEKPAVTQPAGHEGHH